jgi:beta-glucanase (GH16 family)
MESSYNREWVFRRIPRNLKEVETMKVGLSNVQSRLQRRFPNYTTVLTKVMVLLIAFALLTESSCLGDVLGIKVAPVPVETTTHQASPWKLAWRDEFDRPRGAVPDPSKWTSNVGGEGWGNHQLEYNTNNQNAYHDGQGNLVLEARKGNPAGYHCWYGPCQYTSAHITTRGHFSFTYGLLEARIKIPYDQGIWTSFWLLGSNYKTVGWPACGEIDVMENVSPESATIYGSVHGPENFSSSYKLQHGAFADNFHIFALEWNADHLYFFVDGDNYAVLPRTTLKKQAHWVYDHPFDIILNLAVGGNWPGNPSSTTKFPQRLYVSYMRLYTDK